jgi:hypothetical protein
VANTADEIPREPVAGLEKGLYTHQIVIYRIFRTFGAGWRGKLDIFDTLKK